MSTHTWPAHGRQCIILGSTGSTGLWNSRTLQSRRLGLRLRLPRNATLQQLVCALDFTTLPWMETCCAFRARCCTLPRSTNLTRSDGRIRHLEHPIPQPRVTPAPVHACPLLDGTCASIDRDIARFHRFQSWPPPGAELALLAFFALLNPCPPSSASRNRIARHAVSHTHPSPGGPLHIGHSQALLPQRL